MKSYLLDNSKALVIISYLPSSINWSNIHTNAPIISGSLPYILVLNPDNENDLKKSTIFNFPVAEYKKKKSFEELEPLYENSYCLLILNKLFFRDSTNFQLALDKYFGEDENINIDIKKEEIKTKKIKQREKSHFM